MRYGFTILHYLDAKVTEKCVKSLLEICGDNDVSIVVVDNGSHNGSGEKLRDVFKDESTVKVLLLNSNLGFAEGNNAGYAYLKENFNPDFIICANNDVIFNDKAFLESVDRSYDDYNFDVMGPDIVDADGENHLNPHCNGGVTEEHVKKSLKDIRLPYLIYRTALLVPLYEFYKRRKNRRRIQQPRYYKEANNDCTLQGSCLIFSKKYIAAHSKAFCSYTFLYYEEYILKMVIDSENGRMVYDPRLSLVHLGGHSTGKALGMGRRKTVFLMGQYIRSWKAWLRVCDELKRGINPLV